MNSMATVVVSSCDKYEEAWYPFFALFRKYWEDCKFDVILNTETKKCSEPDVITVNASGQWCGRLNSVLDYVTTPYVILLLDDFFFNKDVNKEEIDNCINIMNSDESIACFYYRYINCNKSNKIFYNKYYELLPLSENNMYLLNLQAGLWRKSVLQDILRKMSNNSPWDFEYYGYDNCKEILQNKHFYCSNNIEGYETDINDVISYYVKLKHGIGIRNSKWLWNNKKFFKREGINVQYKELKTMSWLECNYHEIVKPFVFKSKQFIKRRLKRVIR